MIMVDGRTRSVRARSHRSTPGAQVFRWRARRARPDGRGPLPERRPRPLPRPRVTARYRDLRVVLTCDHERP